MAACAAAAVRHSARRRPRMSQVGSSSSFPGNAEPGKRSIAAVFCFPILWDGSEVEFLSAKVVRALEGDATLEELNDGVRPGQSSVYASYSSSDYDDGQYKEDMRRFRKLALTSEEFAASSSSSGGGGGGAGRGDLPPPHRRSSGGRSGAGGREYVSSDCSGATSEYGQNPSGSSSEAVPSGEMEAGRTNNSDGAGGRREPGGP